MRGGLNDDGSRSETGLRFVGRAGFRLYLGSRLAAAAQPCNGGVNPIRAQSSRSSVFRDFDAVPIAGVTSLNSFVAERAVALICCVYLDAQQKMLSLPRADDAHELLEFAALQLEINLAEPLVQNFVQVGAVLELSQCFEKAARQLM
jgi:hypothetical protein